MGLRGLCCVLALCAGSATAQSFPSAIQDLRPYSYPSYDTKRCAVLIELLATPPMSDLAALSVAQANTLTDAAGLLRNMSDFLWDMAPGIYRQDDDSYRDPLPLARSTQPIAEIYTSMLEDNFVRYGDPLHGIVGRDVDTCQQMLGLDILR